MRIRESVATIKTNLISFLFLILIPRIFIIFDFTKRDLSKSTSVFIMNLSRNVELVSKPYLNVIPGSTRRRMTVATRNQILNPQYHSVRGRQVQDDDNR